MSVQQLLSHLGECRRRLSDLRGRQDYLPLSCAILRLEGAGGTVLYQHPLSRILNGRPFHDRLKISHGETFSVAFYPLVEGFKADRIPAAMASVELMTGELHPLLRELPRPVRERLQLPDSDDWWRIVFHLGWHFPRVFLRPVRQRLLARDGAFSAVSDETFVQLHGTGGLSDLLPGLIYSDLKHDLCACSEAAIDVIVDALERHVHSGPTTRPGAQVLSAEERKTFDQLRVEFQAGPHLPSHLECKLLRLADSFTTPPASAWAGLQMGGCVERFLTLSRLDDVQEIVQIRGPATGWFCGLAERAGDALPTFVPDCPILFDDNCGTVGPRPVMTRGSLERWVGFVFATLKRNGHEALRIRWETDMGPMCHGLATLDRDLFAASVLAIDLAGFTTATDTVTAAPTSNLDGVHVAMMPSNCSLGPIILGEGRRFHIASAWCKPVAGSTPTICPQADPPADQAERAALEHFLPEIVKVCRQTGVIRKGQTIHWVGRQISLATVCRCELTVVGTADEGGGENSTKGERGKGKRVDDPTPPVGHSPKPIQTPLVLVEECALALRRLTELLDQPWRALTMLDPPGAYREVMPLLERLVTSAIICGPEDPPVTMGQVRALQDVPTAYALVKRLGHWAATQTGRAEGEKAERTKPIDDASVKPRRARRMSREEANEKAKELAKKDRFFVQRSLREWAEAIGCSEGLVADLPLWREKMRQTGRRLEDAGPVPKVVSLTGDLEAVTGAGERDEELMRLIAEQERDREPSPLDDDSPDSRPRKVHCRKRL